MTLPSINRLNELARERYETGAHKHEHLTMHFATMYQLRHEYTPTTQLLSEDSKQLIGIPVVLDNSIPVGSWRLVNNKTGDVIESW